MEVFLIIATIVLLLFLLSMIWPPDSPWSPWWRTNKVTARAILRLSNIKKSDYIIDLGCGDGTVLITAATEEGASGLGVEIDPFRVFITRARILKNKLSNKVSVRRENLFNTDISQASVIIVYLVPKTLKRLDKKFRKELRPGTKIVSYMYQLQGFDLIKTDTKNSLFLYKI